ncbi:GNAT family N-acetyltransferase [uncultured Prevotella sp.]|uniref:GNAT family N-acetyltransferase n=1 Tax=uncultured Prevotella sp. TaxID=159272 RepID=UPI0025D4009E|nr:GNAT family N-acetyltransferase [uncultured Prevotella sp.]
MIQKQISTENANDGQLKLLYETAFPKEEQIPWDDLVRLIGEMNLDFTAYYNENQLIGFTIVYPRPSLTSSSSVATQPCSSELGRPSLLRPFNWYWYFAVKEELRGKGLGQQILNQLIEKYKGQSCVLDMESPRQECANKEQRLRRQAFYLRNGFRDTNVYRCWDDLEMTIMMMGPGTFTLQDWDEIVGELRKYWTWDKNKD